MCLAERHWNSRGVGRMLGRLLEASPHGAKGRPYCTKAVLSVASATWLFLAVGCRPAAWGSDRPCVSACASEGAASRSASENTRQKEDANAAGVWPLFDVMENSGSGYIDRNGTIVIPPVYEMVTSHYWRVAEEDWARGLPVRKGKRWGYVDLRGRMKIAPQFHSACPYYEGRASVSVLVDPNSDRDDEFWSFPEVRWGCIDEKGRYVVTPKYAAFCHFSEGMAAVNVGGRTKDCPLADGGKWGFVDRDGKLVVPAKFDSVSLFLEGRAAVNIGGRSGEGVSCLNEGGLMGGKWGFIDKRGEYVVKPRYGAVGFFSGGLAPVMRLREIDGAEEAWEQWGFVDTRGRLRIDPRFEEAKQFAYGLAPVKKDGKWGFIDKSGKVAVAFRFDAARRFFGGLAAVQLDGKWGFIDKAGRVAIKPVYGDVRNFSEGFAAAKRGRFWGYINTKGVTTVPYEHPSAKDYLNGLARVWAYVYIDARGRRVWFPGKRGKR